MQGIAIYRHSFATPLVPIALRNGTSSQFLLDDAIGTIVRGGVKHHAIFAILVLTMFVYSFYNIHFSAFPQSSNKSCCCNTWSILSALSIYHKYGQGLQSRNNHLHYSSYRTSCHRCVCPLFLHNHNSYKYLVPFAYPIHI